jgi:putative peptidoglycan lipid II flippase
MKSARGKIVKAAGLLMALQGFEQVTGLLKQILIAAAFGISATMDSYVVAISVTGLIMLWVRLPVRETLIPLFRYDFVRRGERAAWANASVLLNNFFIALILIVLLGELVAPYVVGILAPGFDPEAKSLATSLARITIITVVCMGMGTLLAQISYSYEKFFRPGVVGTVNNLVVILGLFLLGSAYGIYGLAVAVVVGGACEFILQLPILWQKRRFYSPHVNLAHPEMLQMGKLSFPLLISTGGHEVARITDRMFASLLTAGSLSALAFAHRPVSVLADCLIHPFQQAIFPHFTKLSAKGDLPTLSRQLFYYLRVISLITLPAAVGIMVTGEAAVRALYQRGAFDETAVQLTSQALFFYAIGFPALAVMRILRRTFFGLKDTWTPTKIALMCIGIKIVLSWVLIGSLAHAGIALADSISQLTNALTLFWFLPKEVRGEEGWKTLGAFAQTLVGCLVMGVVVYFAKERIYGLFAPSLNLVFLAVVGVVVYGGTTLFQVEARQSVLKALTELGGKYMPRSS